MTLPQRNAHPAHNGQPSSPAIVRRRPDRDHSPADPRLTARSPAGSELARAIDQTQENLLALQRLAEQTAQLHRQFLDGQAAAQQTFHALFLEHQKLTSRSLGQSRVEQVRPPEDEHRDLAPAHPLLLGRRRRGRQTTIFPPRTSTQQAPRGMATDQPSPGHLACRRSAPASRPRRQRPRRQRPRRRRRILLEIVAEKTGYPPEMLELDMQLDADLGIDSIKRVEILSAVQDRLPEAPWSGPSRSEPCGPSARSPSSSRVRLRPDPAVR